MQLFSFHWDGPVLTDSHWFWLVFPVMACVMACHCLLSIPLILLWIIGSHLIQAKDLLIGWHFRRYFWFSQYLQSSSSMWWKRIGIRSHAVLGTVTRSREVPRVLYKTDGPTGSPDWPYALAYGGILHRRYTFHDASSLPHPTSQHQALFWRYIYK